MGTAKLYKSGERVVAKRDTRKGVMCAEPVHIGRIALIVNHTKMGSDVCYQLDFDGHVDYADHCTLEAV